MEFNILDQSYQWIGVIDQYKSAIWTPRYYEAGDFEIYIEATIDYLSLLQKDFYVTRPDDDMVCVIEKINLTGDKEDGKYLIVTGRDLKSILGRRIIWNQTTLKGTVEEGIRQLITENVIYPTDRNRRIENFVLGPCKGFAEELDMQVTGQNLLDVIQNLCQMYGYGFKITLNDSQEFVFDLYQGANRSYSQNQLPYVVFSPDFDNVKSMDYITDKTDYKNVALVAGEGEGMVRKVAEVGNGSGLWRYETYVDARDLSTNQGQEEEISLEDYTMQLKERGEEALSEMVIRESFEGEVEPLVNYVYKQDYFLGDVIQIESEFGLQAASRITEIIECADENGYSMTPTFSQEEKR